jgi:galactose-1-phosphate uridylyltransferase
MELRKHYILNRWTYIASGRGSRPKEYKSSELFPNVKSCFFCPGNEEPELEIGRIKKGNSWLIRWIKNKYPSLVLNPEKFNGKNIGKFLL